MELRENVYFNIFILFIVGTTSILKLVFPTVYYFCLDGYFGSCVVAIIATAVVVAFIYLFINLFIIFSIVSTVILVFVVVVVVIATVAFVVGLMVAFCVCWVIAIGNLMLMFSVLVLLFVPYFAVCNVDK